MPQPHADRRPTSLLHPLALPPGSPANEAWPASVPQPPGPLLACLAWGLCVLVISGVWAAVVLGGMHLLAWLWP